MKRPVAFFTSCVATRAVKLRVKIAACLTCLAVAVPTGLAVSLLICPGLAVVPFCGAWCWRFEALGSWSFLISCVFCCR